MHLLSECVGARGFEADTYFESALREAPMIPSLEGSTHINFGLTAQFLDPYFADPSGDPPAPGSLRPGKGRRRRESVLAGRPRPARRGRSGSPRACAPTGR